MAFDCVKSARSLSGIEEGVNDKVVRCIGCGEKCDKKEVLSLGGKNFCKLCYGDKVKLYIT